MSYYKPLGKEWIYDCKIVNQNNTTLAHSLAAAGIVPTKD